MKYDVYTFKASSHLVSALINDDESGLDDDEATILWEWEQNLPKHFHFKTPKHKNWDVSEDEEECICEICNMFSKCVTLTLTYI